MTAEEFRKEKYGDQRYLFTDQNQELIDRMMEEYAEQRVNEYSEKMWSALGTLFKEFNKQTK